MWMAVVLIAVMISSVCAWRWKDRTPPERIAPSFSVNRVNYLYNEICKVVNFSSSLFLPPQLFTLPCTFPFSAHPELHSFPSTPLKIIMSLSCISISSIGSHLAFYPPPSPPPYSFSPSPSFSPALHLLCLLLFWPYLSFSRSLLIYPRPSSTHLTGVWAFNIQSMPPSSEPSFSSAGFDRQVPPPPLHTHLPSPSPSASISITAHERGRCREGGGRDRVHPQDSGRRADRQMGKGLRRRGRRAVERVKGLKGLPLLGMEGTGRLRRCRREQTEALADSCP